MSNGLDEVNGPINPEGQDVNVIAKQLPAVVGAGTKVYEISIWVVGVIVAFGVGMAATKKPAMAGLAGILGVAPGLIFQFMKTNALAYLRKLEQNIQAAASQVDNFLEQRVVILQNLASILDKSIDLDKDVMKSVAAYRGGGAPNSDQKRNETASSVDQAADSAADQAADRKDSSPVSRNLRVTLGNSPNFLVSQYFRTASRATFRANSRKTSVASYPQTALRLVPTDLSLPCRISPDSSTHQTYGPGA